MDARHGRLHSRREPRRLARPRRNVSVALRARDAAGRTSAGCRDRRRRGSRCGRGHRRGFVRRQFRVHRDASGHPSGGRFALRGPEGRPRAGDRAFRNRLADRREAGSRDRSGGAPGRASRPRRGGRPRDRGDPRSGTGSGPRREAARSRSRWAGASRRPRPDDRTDSQGTRERRRAGRNARVPRAARTALVTTVLVANRGEIARRIFRTVRRMGMKSVAVYSDADAGLPFVREADTAVRIGPASARQSYLAIDRILAAAEETKADLIHPGYGFLAESPQFAHAIAADDRGNVLSFGERDCSAQRRNQKIIEETPAPALTSEQRGALAEAAVAIAREAGYRNAGTVEFVVDAAGFFFLEVNARLQVEHPVTELVWNVDLVEEQLRIALGEALSRTDARTSGHAVEARLYAEDPSAGFVPSAGRIAYLRWDEDVRVDSGYEEGSLVTTSYDPLIAKLIARADTRAGALAKLERALERSGVLGVRTNREFR